MGNPVQASRICITPTMAAVKHASPTYSSGQVSGTAWPMVVKHGGRHPGDLKLGELPVTPQLFFFSRYWYNCSQLQARTESK